MESHDEDRFFGLALIEQCEGLGRFVEAEGVGGQLRQVDLLGDQQVGDLGVLGDAEVPRADQADLFADQLFAGADGGLLGLADEGHLAERAHGVERHVLRRRIARTVDRRAQAVAMAELLDGVHHTGRRRVQHQVGAQLERELAPLGDRVEGHDPRPQRSGRQDAAGTHRPHAPDAQRAGARQLELLAGAVERAEGVSGNGRRDEAQGIGDAQTVAFGHDHVVGIAAIGGEADALPGRAQVEDAAPAGRAGAAAQRQVHRHAVPDTQGRDALAEFLDEAGRFMAADEAAGLDTAQYGIAVVQAHVAAADARGLDGDPHLCVTGTRWVDVAHHHPYQHRIR